MMVLLNLSRGEMLSRVRVTIIAEWTTIMMIATLRITAKTISKTHRSSTE